MNVTVTVHAMRTLVVAHVTTFTMVNRARTRIVPFSMAVFATTRVPAEKQINQMTTLGLVYATFHTSVTTAGRSTALHQHRTKTFRGMACIASRSAMVMVPAIMQQDVATVTLAMVVLIVLARKASAQFRTGIGSWSIVFAMGRVLATMLQGYVTASLRSILVWIALTVVAQFILKSMVWSAMDMANAFKASMSVANGPEFANVKMAGLVSHAMSTMLQQLQRSRHNHHRSGRHHI
jgi:hypothetical protein